MGPQGPAGEVVHDTTYIITRDTVLTRDTVISRDTIIGYDTITIRDTIVRYDTLTIKDTLYLSGNWANVLDSIKTSSYMIGLRNETNGELILVGSGAAISSNIIITNAHVWYGMLSQYIIYKQLGYNITPVAVQNGASAFGAGVYEIDVGGIHNGYADTTVFTYDIGYFVTPSAMSKFMASIKNETIQKIKVGQEIGTLGFPGETADRLTRIVSATFKNGVISSLTPFKASDFPSISNTYVIQHNFNTTSGTSGSPIFDLYGRMIGVNNSGAVKGIWNDAISNFSFIPVGSIGYGIRYDVVNDMFAKTLNNRDTISSYYIPSRYTFYLGSRICLKDGTKPVYLGTTIAAARSAANTLFIKAAPDYVDSSDGSLYYTDYCSYKIWILKESATIDNVWSIWIGSYNDQIYLPSFRDQWGVTIGTSRTYILNTYGYNYTNSFSIDSSTYYYNYSTLGIGFGFSMEETDWNCDAIQIAQTGLLPKRVAGTLESGFPNLGKSYINLQPKKRLKVIPIEISKIFK